MDSMEQMDRSQRGLNEGAIEDFSPRTRMHMFRAHGHRQQCSEGGGGAPWRRGARGGGGWGLL